MEHRAVREHTASVYQRQRAVAHRVDIERHGRQSVREGEEQVDRAGRLIFLVAALRLKVLRRQVHAVFPDDASGRCRRQAHGGAWGCFAGGGRMLELGFTGKNPRARIAREGCRVNN
jgi:hypothetical protein